jgi:hypothetical protein
MDGSAVDPPQGSEHWAVVLAQQSLRHMQPVVGIDPNQMCVEGRVVYLGERYAIGHDGLPEPLILILCYVRRIEQ